MNTSESSRSPSPESSSEEEGGSAADIILTPGKVFNTPLNCRSALPSDTAWSSSPVRSGVRKTSFSPPECMASPVFSPIIKTRRNNTQGSSGEEEPQDDADHTADMETVDRSGARRMLQHDMTAGELYQTAEIDCDEDAADGEEEDHSPAVSHVSMDVDPVTGDSENVSEAAMSHSVVHAEDTQDNWTMSMARNDTSSRSGAVDAGYGSTESTQHTASISNLTPGSASVSASASGLSRQDSGVAGAGADTTCGVSVLAPGPAPPPAQHSSVLMSYHVNDNSNDISVGFPLGSSTPTKK